MVATRPTNLNGFGWTTAECRVRLVRLKRVFRFLPDPPSLFDVWELLVFAHDYKGKVADDAWLVAAMQLHGVAEILTFNIADFARFPSIAAINPASVTP